jgi:translation elongation factor Ts
MAEITAKMVSDLRAATGLGMMECKKALVEAEGDAAKAEEILRIKSGNKASKMAGRLAAEGIIGSYVAGGVGALVEVNCETDFVAKDPTFLALALLLPRLLQLPTRLMLKPCPLLKSMACPLKKSARLPSPSWART